MPPVIRLILTGIKAICGFIVLSIALLSLAGWIGGNESLTTFGEGYIPMSPNTSILFVLCSLTYLMVIFARQNRVIRMMALAAAIILIGFSFPMLILNWFNVHPAFETLGFSVNQNEEIVMIGHMSPVTLFLFTISGVAVVILLLRKPGFFSTLVPPLLSGTTLLVSMVILIGYLVGKPLLYNINQIPMALNTSIGFFATGLVLTMESLMLPTGFEKDAGHQEGRSLHVFSIIIAVIITGIMFFGYINILTIFKNIREEVKNELTLIGHYKALEIKEFLNAGGDPGQVGQFLAWPMTTEKGHVQVLPDSTSFSGRRKFKGLTEIIGADQKKYEICVTPMEGTGWVVVTSMEKSIAFRPMVKQFNQVGILILSLLSLTVTILILFSRQSKLRFFKDQLHSAEKLRLAEEQFRNAFEHSSVGKTMVYMNGRYLVNQSFAGMLGYTMEELNNKSWDQITHPDDQAMSRQIMNSMVSGEMDSYRFEKRYLHKDGQAIWVDLHTYLQRDKAGKPIYFITSASNISDYKELQEQLIRSKEEAELSNKLKDAFIANISHEIRTPLNAILGFTDLVRDEMDEMEITGFDNYFDIIRGSGQRLTRTVDMILNLSRLQVGAYQPHFIEMQLDAVVQSLISEYRLTAQKKGISIVFENQLGTVMVRTDEYCLVHSISNLIDNAVKYTPSGSVRVNLYRNAEEFVCLDVADTGIGISEEFMSQVFSPFTQEEPGSTRRFEGIGLGLSIAYRLLSVTGATIRVKSRKGEGTLFTVTFPNLRS